MLKASQAGYAVDDKWLVRDLDMEVRPGRVTAVVGPNGAGKSTAMRLLAGLLRPCAGSVLVNGEPTDSLPRTALARQVSYVPVDPPGLAAFTVRECVSMGRYCHRGRFQPERDADRAAVTAALEATDCGHLADRFLNELSTGESRRVALARGLATEARHLLLDEPTASLDIEHSLALLELVQRIAAAGRSVLVAMHDLNGALSATQYVYLLHRGTLRAAGKPSEVLTAYTIREVFSVEAVMLGSGRQRVFRFAAKPGPDPRKSRSTCPDLELPRS